MISAPKGRNVIACGIATGREDKFVDQALSKFGHSRPKLFIGASGLQPTDAINYFVKAAQYEGSSKKDPMTYYFLADLYEKGEYTKLVTQYNTSCKTPEQLQTQECKDPGVKVNQGSGLVTLGNQFSPKIW